ncbi:MAG: DUF192 domain-containing protein [Candidatus Diapherotrites archaeon]
MNVQLKRVRTARSFWQKFLGLMFKEAKEVDYALVFPLHVSSRFGASIHMLFMKFPIDVFWLDAGKKVVDVRKNVRPWTLNVSPRKSAHYIVEVKCGKVRAKIGDSMDWK